MYVYVCVHCTWMNERTQLSSLWEGLGQLSGRGSMRAWRGLENTVSCYGCVQSSIPPSSPFSLPCPPLSSPYLPWTDPSFSHSCRAADTPTTKRNQQRLQRSEGENKSGHLYHCCNYLILALESGPRYKHMISRNL